MTSPCIILKSNNVYNDMMDQAEEKCEKIYRSFFLDELEGFCPRRKDGDAMTSENSRKKLAAIFLIVLAVMLVASWVLMALGGAGFEISLSNKSKISEMEMTIQEQEEELGRMNKQMQEQTNRINKIQDKLNSIVDVIKEVKDDVDVLKTTFIPASYAISHVISELTVQRQILRDTKRSWNRGEMHPPFLDIFNFSIPEDNCPPELAEPYRCSLSDDFSDLSLDFFAPVVASSLQLLEADPFKMYVREGSKTCKITYTGPKYVLFEPETKCIYPLSMDEISSADFVVPPANVCQKEVEYSSTSHYFTKSDCQESGPNYYKQFIMVKIQRKNFLVYCYGTTIILDAQETVCPNNVFVVPASTTFSIEGHVYQGRELRISMQKSANPLFSQEINSKLNTSINWDMLKVQDEKLEFWETIVIVKEHKTTFVSFGVGILLLIILLLICCKNRSKLKTLSDLEAIGANVYPSELGRSAIIQYVPEEIPSILYDNRYLVEA